MKHPTGPHPAPGNLTLLLKLSVIVTRALKLPNELKVSHIHTSS